MIVSFKSRKLKRLYERGDGSQVRPDMLPRVRRVLARLDASSSIEQLDAQGYNLHRLTGDLRHYWSITVSRNWRIIFRFEESNALDVDLVDYH